MSWVHYICSYSHSCRPTKSWLDSDPYSQCCQFSRFYCKLSGFLNTSAAGIKGVDEYLHFDVKIKETLERCDQSVSQSGVSCHSSDFWFEGAWLNGFGMLGIGNKILCYIMKWVINHSKSKSFCMSKTPVPISFGGALQVRWMCFADQFKYS